MIDLESLEAESRSLTERSRELAQLLDNSHPVVEGSLPELAESKRLGLVAARARKDVAARVAAGLPAGCVIGRQPPIRRVRTDAKGRDVDPLHGSAVVTDELVEYWTYRKNVLAGAMEQHYHSAAMNPPYSPLLVASSRQHLAILQVRDIRGEGAQELSASLKRYDMAYSALREAANDAQHIATEAEDRLRALRREVAQAEVGGDEVRGFLAHVASTMSGLPVDPETALPLVPTPVHTRVGPSSGLGTWDPQIA
jgi:hypothetical protein